MCLQVATPIKDLLRTSQKNVKQRSDIQDCWMLMSVKDLRRRRNQVNIKCLFRTTWFGVKILLVFVCGSSRVILEFEAFFTKKPTTTDGLWGLNYTMYQDEEQNSQFFGTKFHRNLPQKYENFLPRTYTLTIVCEPLFIHNFMQVIATTQMISFSCKMMTTTFHS